MQWYSKIFSILFKYIKETNLIKKKKKTKTEFLFSNNSRLNHDILHVFIQTKVFFIAIGKQLKRDSARPNPIIYTTANPYPHIY